jgi:M6 family metalloprotease-like protein
MKKSFVTILVSILGVFAPMFMMAQTATELTNLVLFVRFADDAEIDHSFADIDTMFNGKTPGYFSVSNFYDALTYGKIHYNTVYTNNIQNGVIVSYQDIYPRGYFQPYSAENPIGYQEELPFMGVSMREAELLGRVVRYVDSMNWVSSDVNLDGNGDGLVDNVSFIVKGGTGEWADLLWPHMEYFPYDSLVDEPRINGQKIYTFNFEFEGADSALFSTLVFRHEMGHSLDLPDLYHYMYYDEVTPAGSWDMMCYGRSLNQTAAIYRNKILHVSDDPVEITEDGDYTLLSVSSSPAQNCYYIKSAIDPTQWYVLEYRNQNDIFEDSIPGSGLLVARWNDTVPLNYEGSFANSFFDFYNVAHQYWIFRPGSSIDTVNGDIDNAHFSQFVGRTSFGPATDPHPYLTDGTPESSFEITDIYDHGDHLTFHVHFFDTGVEEYQLADNVRVYPNPATDVVNVQCTMNNVQFEVTDMEVYDVYGKVVRIVETLRATSLQTAQINVSGLAPGLYFIRLTTNQGVVTKPFVKK